MIQERTTLMTVKQFFCYSKIFSSFPYRFMLNISKVKLKSKSWFTGVMYIIKETSNYNKKSHKQNECIDKKKIFAHRWFMDRN